MSEGEKFNLPATWDQIKKREPRPEDILPKGKMRLLKLYGADAYFVDSEGTQWHLDSADQEWRVEPYNPKKHQTALYTEPERTPDRTEFDDVEDATLYGMKLWLLQTKELYEEDLIERKKIIERVDIPEKRKGEEKGTIEDFERLISLFTEMIELINDIEKENDLERKNKLKERFTLLYKELFPRKS